MNNTAILVKLRNVRKHPNADSLQLASILGTTIIVGMDNYEDELGIYFDANLQLSEKFCKHNNLFRDKTKNEDQTKSGFIEENCRVKAVRLRGEISNGLFMPLISLNYLINPEDFEEGFEFTKLKGEEICKKYIIPSKQPSGFSGKKTKKVKESRIIEGQFRFHYSTEQLPRNIHNLNPFDRITISVKMHGTSAIVSNCLVKRKLNWFERLLKKLGIKIEETIYDYIYSSRTVIRNPNIVQNSFYEEDLWTEIGSKFKGLLHQGETVYYEIVGYTPNGRHIQKSYDYRCKQGEYKIYIYRITQTSLDGTVTELQMNQIEERSKELGQECVPIKFEGFAADYLSHTEFQIEEEWRESFLEKLKQDFLDKDSEYCVNKVPEEGIVLRIDGLVPKVFKYKSDRFFLHESSSKDKGEEDIEDNN